MHTLEPLCNLQQSELIRDLGFNEETEYTYAFNEDAVWVTSKEDSFKLEYTKDLGHHECNIPAPTISMARNWVFREYGVWITTELSCTIAGHHDVFVSSPNGKEFIVCKSDNPHDCESECLTEILKHLKEKNDASKPL
jgi:hypothetical protein